jgi:hypothetical protein
MLLEIVEVRRMTIHDELRKLGYEFGYEHGDTEERIEVWVNEKAGIVVRIEWMTVDAQGKGRDF